MASNNSFQNQFGKVAREGGDAPLINPAQAFGVPTNVPFVAPPNVIPDNLGDMQRYSGLNQLAQALNVVPVGLSRVADSIHKANERKAAAEQNRQYAVGLNDAAIRASKTRDLFGDYSQKGLMAASDNPYYVMGLQSGIASNMAAQYRNELVQARIDNPYTNPAELQDTIKQKYAPFIQSIAPELAYKNFIEPSLAADKDDEGLYLQKNDEAFGAEILKNTKGTILGTLQSEMKLYYSGNSNLETVQKNLKTTIEEQLKVQSATGIPYKPTAEASVDTIRNFVKTLTKPDGSAATLAEKKAVLKAAETVTLPDGNQLLSLKGVDEKLSKAYEEIVQDSLEVEKLERENAKLTREQNTEPLKADIYLDASGVDGRKLGSWESYLQSALKDPTKPVDIDELKKVYDAQNSGVISEPEQRKTNFSADMWTDVTNNLTPSQITQKYRPLVEAGIIPANDYNEALKAAANSTRRVEEAKKPSTIPDAQLKIYTKEIAAPVEQYDSYELGAWTGFGSKDAIRQINQKLETKWLKEFKRKVAAAGLTEQSTPEEKQAVMDQVWGELEPGIQQDYRWVQQAAKDPRKAPAFAQVLAGSVNPAKFRPGAPTPARKAPVVSPGVSSWWQDQRSFAAANEQFRQRKGPGWEYLVSETKKANKTNRLESFYRQALASPEGEAGKPLLYLVKKLQSRGINTFLSKPQPAQKKGATNAARPQHKPE